MPTWFGPPNDGLHTHTLTFNNHTHNSAPGITGPSGHPGPIGPIGPVGSYGHKLTEGQRIEVLWGSEWTGRKGWVLDPPRNDDSGLYMVELDGEAGIFVFPNHELSMISNLEALAEAFDD